MLRGLLASKIRSPVRKLRQTQVQHCDEGAQGCGHHVLQRRRETKVGMFISPMPGELCTLYLVSATESDNSEPQQRK